MKHRVPSALAATIAILGIFSTPAAAHPGHGVETDGVGLVHFLLQPSHGGVAVVLAFVLVAASVAIKRRRRG